MNQGEEKDEGDSQAPAVNQNTLQTPSDIVRFLAHVHAQHAEGEAKFWIEPGVELAVNYGFKPKQLAEAQKLVEEHLDDIRNAWAKHFPS